MSHKSIIRAALLIAVIVVVAACAAQVSASWGSGSPVGASWVDGPPPVDASAQGG